MSKLLKMLTTVKVTIKVFIILWIFIPNDVIAQNDTIPLNSITIEIIRNKKQYLFQDKPYTGYISYLTDNQKCVDEISKGSLKDRKCTDLILRDNKVVWSVVAEGYNPSTKVKLQALQKEIVREYINKNYQVENKDVVIDTVSIVADTIYKQNNVPYSGYAKDETELYFFYEGSIRFKNTFFSNGNVKKYIELKYQYPNGLYVEYDADGQVLKQGDFSMGKKTGEWIYKNTQYDIVIKNYIFNRLNSFSYYYNNDKLVKCEYYNYGKLDYYYTSIFEGNKETRIYFDKEDNSYLRQVYVNSHLFSHDELKK